MSGSRNLEANSLPPFWEAKIASNDLQNQHVPLHAGGRGPGEEKWEYLDPDGTVRGVFPSEAMLNWNQSGYFHDDLPVRLPYY